MTTLARLLFLCALCSCVFTTSFDGYRTDDATELFAVSGTIEGASAPLALLLNGGSVLSSPNGPFAFPRSLVRGASYVVTRVADPAGQTCAVARGEGTVTSGDVTDVLVRCLSTEASLSSLTVSAGPLSPSFASALVDYTTGPIAVHDLFGTPQTTVTAVTAAEGATLTVAGAPATSGVASAPIPLQKGTNTIDVVVTAPNGKEQTRYRIALAGNSSVYVKASNARTNAVFGSAMAYAAGTMVVGSPSESSLGKGVNGDQSDESSPGTGAAYVFVRSGRTWSQEAYLKPSNPHLGAPGRFGEVVAISGDTIAIGAPNEFSSAKGIDGNQDDLGAVSSGAVYVFVRSGTTWTQQAYVKASNTRINMQFGTSVSIDGDTMIVGAPGESSNAVGVDGDSSNTSMPGSGAAYVFVRKAGVWSQQAYLKASNTKSNTSFGAAVSISSSSSSSTVAIGSYGERSKATGIDGDASDVSAPGSGAAYVFVRSGSTWSQQAYVKASNTRTAASFGLSLALSSDSLAVGSPGESSATTGVNGNQSDASASNAGAVYVLVRNAGTWTQQAYLKASNTHGGDAFGYRVAIAGDRLLTGSVHEPSGATGIDGNQADLTKPDAGAGYLFSRSGVAWMQRAYLKATSTAKSSLFGYSLCLGVDAIGIGAATESSGASGIGGDETDMTAGGSGAAYFF